MKGNVKRSLVAVSVAAAIAAPSAYATNGYFVHGYGTKSTGMGGVGIALPQDAIVNATNPSGMSWLGSSRVDAGVMLFNPRRDGSLNATGLDGDGPGPYQGSASSDTSGATLFLVPNAGFVLNTSNISMGLSIFANGGMNTRYNTNIFTNAFGSAIGNSSNAVFGPAGGFAAALEGGFGVPAATIDASLMQLFGGPTGPALGVNLAQLIIAPSVSTKLGSNHSLGASLLVGYQRFRAYGLGLFTGLSADPSHVSNKGDDDAWGAGVRLGWTGQLTSNLTVGATASSKIYMQEFDRYKGLFAEQGDFDIPANFGVGIAFKPNSKTTIAFDVQRILYGDVPSIANAGPTADEFLGGLTQALSGGTVSCAAIGVTTCKLLGNDDGYGFGWDDVTVYKLGVDYDISTQWTVRAGFNYGESPIADSQNLFNIIAPGVVEKHATVGFTFRPDASSEISFAYMHAFRKDQSYTYTNPITAAGFGPQSYSADIGMSQNAVELSYGVKF